MTNDPDESEARALFEAQVAATDGTTRTALRARRQAALQRVHAPSRPRWWMPAGGMATAALAFVLFLPRGAVDGPESPLAGAASPSTSAPNRAEVGVGIDATTNAEGAAIELEHDADFFTWLAEAPADFDELAPPATGPNDGWTP